MLVFIAIRSGLNIRSVFALAQTCSPTWAPRSRARLCSATPTPSSMGRCLTGRRWPTAAVLTNTKSARGASAASTLTFTRHDWCRWGRCCQGGLSRSGVSSEQTASCVHRIKGIELMRCVFVYLTFQVQMCSSGSYVISRQGSNVALWEHCLSAWTSNLQFWERSVKRWAIVQVFTKSFFFLFFFYLRSASVGCIDSTTRIMLCK